MSIEKIFVGGWFGRTSLHLSEIHDFLTEGSSPLELDQNKLKTLRRALCIVDLEFHKGALDHIYFETESGVEVRIYEDGLIVLGSVSQDDPHEIIARLTSFYENELSSALGYLFSLGAPIPKELANIKNIYPYFVVLNKAKLKEVNDLLDSFGQTKHFEIKEKAFDIYRGNKLYIINNKTEKLEHIEKFIGEQIFIREFKGQLHRYLNIHRLIWERIEGVKERGTIKGSDIGGFKSKVERYAKTINLIDARINQMSIYVHTRGGITEEDDAFKNFRHVLAYKYDTLNNAHKYVKDIWAMTKNYVDSALSLFGDLQAKSTNNSVKNLTIVTSLGVGATIIGLFAQRTPEFTWFKLLYFVILVAVGYAANKLLARHAQNKDYSIKNIEIERDI